MAREQQQSGIRTFTRRARQTNGLNREPIVRAAEQLLTCRNINESVTATRIAATAGLPTPVIYRHFDNSTQIISAVIDDIFADLRYATASPPTNNPVDDLYQLCGSYLAYARTNADRYRLLMNSDLTTPVQQKWIQQHFTDLFTDAITSCNARQNPNNTNPAEKALLLWAFLHGLASSTCPDPETSLINSAPCQIITTIVEL